MDEVQSHTRLESIDVLRGFDMFMIVGFDRIVKTFCQQVDHPVCRVLQNQFTHVEWEGFRFYDLIFPLFLFIIGVVIPFSLSKRIKRGDNRKRIIIHIALRTLTLILLGMIVNGNLLTFDPVRLQITYSVLQMLALGYLVASIIYLTCPFKRQVIITVSLLLIYYLMQSFVPVPGHEIGVMKEHANFGDWLNDLILGDLQGPWRFGWIFEILTHASTALLGVLAGQMLMSEAPPWVKARRLLVSGAVCLLVGLIWGYVLPSPLRFAVIKNRWTSSFVLVAGGWSFLLLGLFYLVIDVWYLRKWGFFFKVIGANAIFAYMATALFSWQSSAFRQAAEVFLGGLQSCLGRWYETIIAIGAFMVLWLILYWMYRKNTFVKI